VHPAIRIENLGKCYRIRHDGKQNGRYKTLRDALTDVAMTPLRRWRNGCENGSREDFWALKGVSFDVQPGEVVGIIGRNGAGKSTLLKILSRITKPTTGQVTLHGRVGSLLEVGTGFHPELTGRENIYLNGSILGMSRTEIRRQFGAIVEFSGVEQFLDTPVKRYSSGMYVRLAFAVAAHLNPEILIVDEVLAVGDAEFQQKCLGKMGQVARSGRTVLFVSHNMTAVQQLCERVVLVRQGCVVRDGNSEDALAEYLGDAVQSSGGSFDLNSHASRSSKHIAIIQSVTLSRRDGIETTQFYSEDEATIDIKLNLPSQLQSPRLAISIEDSLGRRIFTVASYFCQNPLRDIEGNADIRCVIPKLPLAPGRYLLSVRISDKFRGLLDSLDCVAWLDVIWNNNYGNGESPTPMSGPVLQDSRWSFLPDTK
jgi:lipopolysaccharide transport system ATP-binding protein